MNEPGFASLSPTLLARKGGARPAMRPQHGAPGKVDGREAAANLEDLGWNDMGDTGEDAPAGGDVVQFDSRQGDAPRADPHEPVAPASAPLPAPSPVRETIERIARKLDAPRTIDTSVTRTAAKTAAQIAARPAGKRRAAFTLRLDQDRHLRLRLACTVTGRSAQMLVTDALDAALAAMPEIETLAAQVKRP